MLTLVLILFAFLICRSFYRLYWHPLSRFPGPKLAAASRIYEFYHNVIHTGRYIWKIEELHRKYGTSDAFVPEWTNFSGSIVRVGPNEVHINDPSYFSEIYPGNSQKRNKDKFYLRMLITLSDSTVATGEHELHQKRRNHSLKHFSKKSIVDIEPRLKPSIEKMMEIVQQRGSTGAVFCLDSLAMAMGTDVTSEYLFGLPLGFLDTPDRANTIKDVLFSMSHYGPLMTFIPFGDRLRHLVPTSFIARVSSDTRVVLENERVIRDICALKLQAPATPFSKFTLVDSLNDPTLPPSERTLDRITAESIQFLLAGTETTGWAIAVTMFHLLSERPMLLRLREEIKQVLVRASDYPSWTALEALPYLRAVILEGLRLSLVTINRFPLYDTENTLVYKDWAIPQGTSVSQSMWFVHMNEEIYPEPSKFNPERWLSAGESLMRYFVPFLRGSRDCMGKNLAYAEMYVVVALLVRRFDMELYETGLPDVTPYRDGMITHKADGSQGVRVTVTKVLAD
ncbi:cytochrome P450 [Aspergillus mulundensis]|uniref:Cytochrome P450 n=1 Tax=Aspergillus mulundensis TaxID=1810919 RepID=A0A3D8S5D0_9EURO|nr:hypothetical protein DSM5745_05072 [Aspergillus mulundensis]RDW81515.1 hypothetical protein DSM5745_05072 [Aspergillus mulundensis]